MLCNLLNERTIKQLELVMCAVKDIRAPIPMYGMAIKVYKTDVREKV